MARSVFVQDFKIVDRPYDDVAHRIAGQVEALLDAGLVPARAEGERLQAKVAPWGWPAALGKMVEMHAGQVRDLGGTAILPFSWQASGAFSLFPRFDGDIEVAPFGLHQTMVAVHGNYLPCGGERETPVDQLVLRRLAECVIRAFLEGVCFSLGLAAAT